MQFLYEIPAEFWSLFRSGNRDLYIEALLAINDEYQYNNYFLNREACVQILTDMCREIDPAVLGALQEETPIGRHGTPEDVAQAMCYLADTTFVTGQVLPVNGGFVIT